MSVSLPPSLFLSVTFTRANACKRTQTWTRTHGRMDAHARTQPRRGVRAHARERECTYLARVAPAREGEEVLAEVAAARRMLYVAAFHCTCAATTY